MNSSVVVYAALQLDRQILKLESELKDYLKDAQNKPSYMNVIRYVKTLAQTGSRIAIIVLSTDVYLAHEDDLFTTEKLLKNVGFKVKLTRRLLSVEIPVRGL